MPAPRTNRTLFCSATLLLSCMLPCELPGRLQLMPPSVSYAAAEDADSASSMLFSRPQAAGHPEDANGPYFRLNNTRPVPGELCRSCSRTAQSSSPLKLTKKGQAPFQMPEKTDLPYAAYEKNSAKTPATADAPRPVPFKAIDAASAVDAASANDAAIKTAALQTDKAGKDTVPEEMMPEGIVPEKMVSEELAQKLLLSALPDAGCRAHPVSLAYTPADNAEKRLLSGRSFAGSSLADSSFAKRPAMPEEDRRNKERPAYRPCTMKDMAAVLYSLFRGRAIREDDVLSLLGSAPGVLQKASAGIAEDANGKEKQAAERSAETARQLLMVITEPDCLYCRQAQRFLTGKRLPFPVLFLPAGSSVSARNFYEHALRHAGSSGAYTDSRQEVLRAWLAKTEEWLVQKSGTGIVSLPAFIWFADGTARMSNLSSKALQCLVTAMTWRYERMMLHVAREKAPTQ